ncbi:MAG: hypothetical protein IJ093_02950 [Bacilli bacterium]|nr:hypothetical protein [Bacilli bacterium]
MNVIIANQYRDALATLEIDVIKKLEGEFSVEEIIETFKNFFFQRMILDITALKNGKDIKTLQKLSLALDVDKLILLLDNSPEVTSPEFLSDLISMRIYNFTMNIEGVNYLYNNPNSYRDVAQYHQLDTNHDATYGASEPTQTVVYQQSSTARVIGLKNVTDGAGSTTLAYIMKKQLERNYSVVALELDKRDFMYFSDKDMISISSAELGNYIAKYSSKDVIIVDINGKSTGENFINEILYLIEPSKLKLNQLLARNPRILSNYKGKKIVLNKSLLSSHDVLDFEYETNSKIFYSLPPLYDQENNNRSLDGLLAKLGFVKQNSGETEEKKGILGMFKQ